MSVRPRYWLPPALLAHVDDGGVSNKLETPGLNANGRGIRRSVQTLGTWRSRNPEASGSARSIVPRGSKIGGAESLPPRSWFTKHSVSTCISHLRTQVFACPARRRSATYGCLTAAASRPVIVQTKTTLCGGSLGSCVDEQRSQLRELK
ncbi:hypothetical protein DPMN_167014 [Dreissena polymorpha]|uniref:Uncharacterized protein n=1 Tax=Dreissena polymorpha TaxID=45954 RepID=A0A9D4F3M5_DREPO|nr:hypothetical protein DPMN_167014 [Dreissena polymorpha]